MRKPTSKATYEQNLKRVLQEAKGLEAHLKQFPDDIETNAEVQKQLDDRYSQASKLETAIEKQKKARDSDEELITLTVNPYVFEYLQKTGFPRNLLTPVLKDELYGLVNKVLQIYGFVSRRQKNMPKQWIDKCLTEKHNYMFTHGSTNGRPSGYVRIDG